MAGEDQGTTLTALREEIDRIDGALHGLLMERGTIIDRLIATKGTGASGSAFRPEREAAMMRVLAERHRGRLPLDAIEGIWRVIISTFTHVQAPFSVHLDGSADGTTLRDSARFHFGFTVPLDTLSGPEAVVAAVAGSRGDLGLLPLADAGACWWGGLEGPDAPKVIARLPFVERPDHPAGLPVLVIAKAISGEGVGSVVLYASRNVDGLRAAALALDGAVIAAAGSEALLAVPRAHDPEAVAARLGTEVRFVGSYPTKTRVVGAL